MSVILLSSVRVIAVLTALWLVAGSLISGLIDRCYTVREEAIPTGQLSINADVILMGSRNWTMPKELAIGTDSANHLTLTKSGLVFTLGPVTDIGGESNPLYSFTPDPGDTVTFDRSHSLLSWPTPLQLNVLVGGRRRSSWQRHCQERLLWSKANGARLEMVWRTDERYFPKDGGWDHVRSEDPPIVTILAAPHP